MADGGEREDARARADLRFARHHDMREELDPLRQCHARADVAERADLDALFQRRAGLDDGALVDEAQESTISAETSASQTSAPSTRASPLNHQMLRRWAILVMCRRS